MLLRKTKIYRQQKNQKLRKEKRKINQGSLIHSILMVINIE
jgi:hypothetical protein